MSFAIHPFHNAKHGLQLILPVLWSQSFWTSLSLLNWMPMNLTGCNKPYITSLITNCPMTAWTLSVQIFLWFPSLCHPPSTLNPKPNLSSPQLLILHKSLPRTSRFCATGLTSSLFVVSFTSWTQIKPVVIIGSVMSVFILKWPRNSPAEAVEVFAIHPFRLQIVGFRLILPAFSIQLFLMQ